MQKYSPNLSAKLTDCGQHLISLVLCSPRTSLYIMLQQFSIPILNSNSQFQFSIPILNYQLFAIRGELTVLVSQYSARKEAQNGSSLPHNHNHRKVGKTSMKIEMNDRKSKDEDDLIFLLPWQTCVDCTDSQINGNFLHIWCFNTLNP